MRPAWSLLFGLVLAGFAVAQESQPASRPESRPESRAESQPTSRADGGGTESAPASRGRRGGGRRPPGGATTRPESGPAGADSRHAAASRPDESPFVAIKDGTVYTVSSGIIRHGTVLLHKDKIVEVGRHVVIPEGARVIDATNKCVTPGLIAVRAFGTFGGGFAGVGSEKTSDQMDPFSQSMLMALSSGITTACEGGTPSPQGQIGGFIGKHTYGSVDGVLVREPAAVFLQLAGDAMARMQTRESLARVVDYRHKRAAFLAEVLKGNKDAKPPALDDALKPMIRVCDGELPCIVTASTRQDIEGAVDLAAEFDFPITLLDAHEAWTVTSKLARGRVSCILNPRQRGPAGNEPDPFKTAANGWTIENAAKLSAAGVPWAVQPLSPFAGTGGLPGRDLLQLNMDAAFTVRGGATDEMALRAITLTAAEILKLDTRLGSLDAGKDADVVIMDLDPLDYRSFAEVVIVNGRTVYEKDKVSFFNHIQTDRAKGLMGKWWNDR